MDKISRILRLANNFYKQALISIGANPVEEEEDEKPIDISDESIPAIERLSGDNGLFDNTVNPKLGGLIEQFIDLRQDLLNLYENPIQSPEQLEELVEISEEFQKVWENIAKSNYLELDPDSDEYQEIYPPHQIVTLIEDVLSDTNKIIEEKKKTANFDQAEMEAVKQKALQDVMMPSAAKGVEQQREGDKEQNYRNKQEKLKEYIKKWYEKIKEIRKFGPERLAAKRKELQDKIDTSTNTEEVKELNLRLKELPDPEMLHKLNARKKAAWQNVMSSPEKQKQYYAQWQKRFNNFSKNEKEKIKLIEAIKASTNPAEKALLAKKLIRMQEDILEKSGVNLHDEWVRNDPNIQAALNVDKIIKLYEDKQSKIKQRRKDVASKIRELKQSGNLAGTIKKLQQNVPNIKSELKKTLMKQEAARLIAEASAEEKTKYKIYLDKIAAAHQAKDKALLKKAIEDLQKALGEVVEKFERMKEFINTYAVVTEYREELQKLDKSKLLTQQNISPEQNVFLSSLVEKGNRIMRAPGLRAETVQYISDILDHITNFQAQTFQARVSVEPPLRVSLDETDQYEDMEEEEKPELRRMRRDRE